MPDVPSEPPNETVTGWLYQPSPSAARSADGATDGAVASYLSAYDEAALTFPAWSRQVPETDALPESGPL